MNDLRGRVALVTGGATGIGRAMAQALAVAGAKVWIASRDEAAIVRAVGELGSRKLAADGRRLDVVDSRQVTAVVDEIISIDGKIDVLFNGAGVMIKHPVVNMPEDDWDQMIEVNLKGAFLCAQAVGRDMIARGYGRIINVSSGHAKGNAMNSAYAASKGGLESFTKTFALELKQLDVDVTINAIEPGGTDTAMWRRGKSTGYIEKALADGRIRTPDFMRDVVLYLASPGSNNINGEIISHRERDRFIARISTNEPKA